MTDIAKAYGATLYELANEAKAVDQINEELAALRAIFEENPRFVSLMSTPTLKKEERVEIIDKTFGGKIHSYLLNFLKIITENGTAAEFIDTAKDFRDRYNLERGIETVVAVSAVPLTPKMEKQLIKKLSDLTGKTIQLEKKVDPDCKGGIRLNMDGLQLDGTVKHKLDAIRASLLRVIA
ncbi:MAG: ATP synthase F1 subunit delta [Butyricicoccaceae bacterium]